MSVDDIQLKYLIDESEKHFIQEILPSEEIPNFYSFIDKYYQPEKRRKMQKEEDDKSQEINAVNLNTPMMASLTK